MTSLLTRYADGLAAQDPQRHETVGALARALDPHTVQTPALNLIDTKLSEVRDGLIERLIITMSPQEGKSERVSRRFPLWMLLDNPDLRIGVASYELGIARRWGRAIRNDITNNPALGLAVSGDTAAAHEWTLRGHIGGVISVGMGGALTGRPLDVLIIDDPVKDRAQAESLAYRERAKEWYTDVARTRLSPGAPVVLIQTRWHEDDLAGWLLASNTEGWVLVNLPAQADHDPTKGETDPLGRAPGEWLVSARGRTEKDWEAIRAAVGARTFAALYQGAPAPVEGDVLLRSWWRRYGQPKAVLRDDGTWYAAGADLVLQSWDMAFKDTKSSDFVVGQVWGLWGNQAFLLHQIRARLSFTASVEAVKDLSRLWPQARLKLVEDKANGPAVINTLSHEVSGLVPVNPGRDSKLGRALAVTPFIEAGQVWLPEERVATFDVQGLIDEAAAFPNSPHDDQVDALDQALNRIFGRGHGVASVASPAGRAGRSPMRTPGLPVPR